MKIALIWPQGYDTTYVVPLALGYLKSNLGKEHNIKILDCSINNISANSEELIKFIKVFNPKVVGVSAWSHTYKESVEILKTIKSVNKNIITVIGGAHVTCYPNMAIKEKAVDFIFRGESELSFPFFIKELEKKEPDFSKIKGLVYKIDKKYIENKMERETNLDKINIPDYEAINFNKYLKQGYNFNTHHKMNAPIWVTRGCPYGCKFCSASIQNGKIIRKHSIDYIIKWIKYLYYHKRIKHISIIDDNFAFDIKFAKNICKEIIKLNLKLSIGSPNGIKVERIDSELLDLMKKAGWENIVIAPESGSDRILKKMGKNNNTKLILKKIKEIKNKGFKINGFFIIGYPGETKEDIKKTIKFLRKCKFNFFFLNNFQPLPGTEIYNELVRNNEIQEGVMPKNYSDGERTYIPEELKDINFPKLILGEYVYLMVNNPFNIPYIIKLINLKMIIKKVYLNFTNMISKND